MVRRMPLLLAALLLLCSCGRDAGAGRLSLSLYLPEGWEDRLDMGALSAPAMTPYIGTVRVVVEKGGSEVARGDAAWSAHRLTLDGLPAGSDYRVTVKAITCGAVILAGSREGVEIGGADASPSQVVLQEANGFAALGSLLYPRQWHAAEMFTANRLVVVGGNTSTVEIEDVLIEKQNISVRAFSSDLPAPANSVSVAFVPETNKLVIVEGPNGRMKNQYHMIDCDNFSCISPSVPKMRDSYYWGAANGSSYFLGGYESALWKYDCIKVDSSNLVRFAVPAIASTIRRDHFSAGIVSGASVFLGGFEGGAFSSKVEVVSFLAEIRIGLYYLTEGKVGCGVAEGPDDDLFVFGGNTNLGISSLVEVFSLGSTAMEIRNPTIKKRDWFPAVNIGNGNILLIGGGGEQESTSAELYDTITGESYIVPWRMRVPRIGHTATKLADGRVVVIGGNMTSRIIEVYNPPVAP